MRDFNSRRVLFDTNVLLDILDPNRPSSAYARLAMEYCNGGGDMGLVHAGQLKDVAYILRKKLNAAAARKAVSYLLDYFVVLPLENEATWLASKSDEPDFEDALVRAAAELNDVEFILTRDAAAFKSSMVRAITCKEYLDIVYAADKEARGMLLHK